MIGVRGDEGTSGRGDHCHDHRDEVFAAPASPTGFLNPVLVSRETIGDSAQNGGSGRA